MARVSTTRLNNPNYDLEYREANRERINRKSREYNSAHKEQCKINHKRWRDANPDKVKAKSQEWRENNPEKVIESNRVRNAIRRSAGRLTRRIIQKVYEYNIKKHGTLTCILCNKPIMFGEDSLEHKMPISRGGTHHYDNLGIAHISCNKRKYNKTMEEYRGVG